MLGHEHKTYVEVVASGGSAPIEWTNPRDYRKRPFEERNEFFRPSSLPEYNTPFGVIAKDISPADSNHVRQETGAVRVEMIGAALGLDYPLYMKLQPLDESGVTICDPDFGHGEERVDEEGKTSIHFRPDTSRDIHGELMKLLEGGLQPSGLSEERKVRRIEERDPEIRSSQERK